MPVDNLQVVLAERPKGEIIPGQTFHQKVTPVPTEADLADGDVLVEVLYLSLDPAMRGWLNGEFFFFACVSSQRPQPKLEETDTRFQTSAHTCLPCRSAP